MFRVSLYTCRKALLHMPQGPTSSYSFSVYMSKKRRASLAPDDIARLLKERREMDASHAQLWPDDKDKFLYKAVVSYSYRVDIQEYDSFVKFLHSQNWELQQATEYIDNFSKHLTLLRDVCDWGRRKQLYSMADVAQIAGLEDSIDKHFPALQPDSPLVN